MQIIREFDHKVTVLGLITSSVVVMIFMVFVTHRIFTLQKDITIQETMSPFVDEKYN